MRHNDVVIRFFLATWGLAAGWLWLIFAARGAATIVASVVLVVASAWLGRSMVLRSQRLRGERDFVNARLEYHQGMSKDRWRRTKVASGDDGGSEFTLGGGF